MSLLPWLSLDYNLDLAADPLYTLMMVLNSSSTGPWLSSDSSVSLLSPPSLSWLSPGAESPLHNIYTTRLITIQPDDSG